MLYLDCRLRTRSPILHTAQINKATLNAKWYMTPFLFGEVSVSAYNNPINDNYFGTIREQEYSFVLPAN